MSGPFQGPVSWSLQNSSIWVWKGKTAAAPLSILSLSFRFMIWKFAISVWIFFNCFMANWKFIQYMIFPLLPLSKLSSVYSLVPAFTSINNYQGSLLFIQHLPYAGVYSFEATETLSDLLKDLCLVSDQFLNQGHLTCETSISATILLPSGYHLAVSPQPAARWQAEKQTKKLGLDSWPYLL